jgi:endonuclease I
MKKIIYTSAFALIASLSAVAQAVLPTSWDFTSIPTYPTGWTPSGTIGNYPTSGNPGVAGKFATANAMIIIDFTTPPGNLMYDLKGNAATGVPFASTLLVEESADGTSWTTLHTWTVANVNTAAYNTTTDVPQNATRHIRFNMSVKASGNFALDNVSIAAGVSTAALMAVKQGTTSILNGGTYTLGSAVSTMTPTTFTVQNLGTVGTLNITSANLSGPAAADFSVATATPFSVAASGSSNLVVNFTPSTSGTRNAVLSIANNDPTANPYIINLNGIGGTLATEPTAQATNMTFPISKSYHIKGMFTAASSAPDGYLVLRRTGSAITDMPVDGTVYQRGDMIGNSKVVYSANATGFFPNEIVANTTYYFAVFSYNGVSTFRNYLTTAPLTGNVTTPATTPVNANYYVGISTSNATFVTDLHNLINPHTLQFYSNYGPLFAATYYTRDTTANQRVITCVYSGLNKVYTEPFDWTGNDFSREHTYCHSWMPTTNDPNFQNRPEYNDYHLLTPTNQTLVNAIRSNYPLGVVTQAPGTLGYSSYLGAKLGTNASGQKVYEPRDADKGDAARCMLYQTICYTGVAYTGPVNTTTSYGGTSTAGTNIWSLPSVCYNTNVNYPQDQNILKLWNTQDPPDNFEMGRNDYVDSLQHNRNPFIDHPEYVCNIDFSTMTYLSTANCGTTGVSEMNQNNDAISFAPNPSNGNFVVNYTASKSQKVTMKLVDMVGRIVYSNQIEVIVGMNSNEINVLNLSKGIYTVEIVSETTKETQKLVIQ